MEKFSIGDILQILAYIAGVASMWGSLQARLKSLEAKMDKHNNLVERLARNEESTKSAHKRIDILEQKGVR